MKNVEVTAILKKMWYAEWRKKPKIESLIPSLYQITIIN